MAAHGSVYISNLEVARWVRLASPNLATSRLLRYTPVGRHFTALGGTHIPGVYLIRIRIRMKYIAGTFLGYRRNGNTRVAPNPMIFNGLTIVLFLV